LLWRIYGDRFLHPSVKQKGIIVGSGEEMKELLEEVNNNPKYGLEFISSIDLNRIADIDFQEEILERVYSEEVQIIAIDLKNEKVEPILPHLYNLIFSRVKFIDMYKIYEDIFDRVPLSLVRYNWFLENISTESHTSYDFLKRLMDIVIGFLAGIVSLIFYPFVFLAIKIDDGKEIFSIQERVGKNNKIIKLLKFRTMTFANDDGKWGNENKNQITRVGKFLRKTRIDELPQLWNVLIGEVSLVGPRPEFAEVVKKYEKEIPYFGVRHLVKPGLSGWAQIYGEHAHHEADVSKTKNKLSYDLYYIKNRSAMLDLKIVLKTIKTLLSKSGV
jgi:lipopolysaccharide/colanic/teichoic acid biosynthesis glycosyltransferase